MVTLSIEVVAENIRLFIENVQSKYDVQAVNLFGSQMMGELDKRSDKDPPREKPLRVLMLACRWKKYKQEFIEE